MKGIKILVCDDVVMIRTLVIKALKDLGYEKITEATNGQEAYDTICKEQANKSQFDLVFIDWNMPFMNGIEVVENCKKDPNLKSIPFIMISAERDNKNIVQALNSGVADYVMKPFSPSILGNKILKVVGAKPKSA